MPLTIVPTTSSPDIPIPPPRPADLTRVPVAKADPPVAPAVRKAKKDVAEMRVNGSTYRDWTSMEVRCEWDAPARGFAFTAAGGAKSNVVDTGSPVQISLGGEQVINGFIEGRSPTLNKDGHTIVLQGRSKTGKMIDSSVPLQSDMKGYPLEAIAKTLLKPHGIGLTVESAPPGFAKAFNRFLPQPGATVWRTLERLGRMRGVIFSDDAQGNLVIRRAMGTTSSPVASLVEGVNILELSGQFRDDVIYSKIMAVGSTPGGDNILTPRDMSATRSNQQAREGTHLVVVAEQAADIGDVATRADMEAARGLWTGVQVSILVPGWNRPDGELWKLSDHVTVVSPVLFLKSDPVTLGTRSLTFTQGPRGTLTLLDLILPQFLTTLAKTGVTGPQSDILDQKDTPAQPDKPDTEST